MRIAVCDDSDKYREKLKDFLEQVKQTGDSIRFYRDGVELLESCKNGYPHDLIFLDVVMPFMDGMKVAGEIRKLAPDTVIVVLTQFPEYATEFYDYNAYRFLVKPVTPQKLEGILADARDVIRKQRFIFIKTNQGHIKESLDRILYFSVKGRKLTAYTVNHGAHEFYGSLSKLTGELPAFSFYQIHQSATVSLYYVQSVTKYAAHMENGDILPVAETRYSGFMSALRRYIGGV